jgi:hypothetical protein
MRNIIINVHRSDEEYPLLSELNKTLIFSTIFLNTQISNLMKIRPVEAELFHANGRTDGQTDRQAEIYDKAFRNFVNVPPT